ncbi:transcription initiation factor TFIID subunit 4-like [Coturnix japonica]|uniref:transcription initiation factor TFIID subunit 4-like n=1 Tax=Coturnix japonica TaxID=93934 RepID=UPI0013A5DA88|nr:transcription initiation factor TFIID subunit 4-like [Coturnix japonica]
MAICGITKVGSQGREHPDGLETKTGEKRWGWVPPGQHTRNRARTARTAKAAERGEAAVEAGMGRGASPGARRLGRERGGGRGGAEHRGQPGEGGVGREGAEEAAPTGKGPEGLSPLPEEPRASRTNGRPFLGVPRSRRTARRHFGSAPSSAGSADPDPPPPSPLKAPLGQTAGGAASHIPPGHPHSPLHCRCRHLPAHEPRSRLGARSALEGRGVANRIARPRPPRPPSYCQGPQRISAPGLCRWMAQTPLAFTIGCAVTAAPGRSRPSVSALGRLHGYHRAGPFPSAVTGWEAGAEAEPPFQTAAKAPRCGWALGHGLRREQVETWLGSSPPPGRAAPAGPGCSTLVLLHSAPLPSGPRVPDASRPLSPQGAGPRDSISKACGISCLSPAGCFPRCPSSSNLRLERTAQRFGRFALGFGAAGHLALRARKLGEESRKMCACTAGAGSQADMSQP